MRQTGNILSSIANALSLTACQKPENNSTLSSPMETVWQEGS